jgi:hypothetical protein
MDSTREIKGMIIIITILYKKNKNKKAICVYIYIYINHNQSSIDYDDMHVDPLIWMCRSNWHPLYCVCFLGT